MYVGEMDAHEIPLHSVSCSPYLSLSQRFAAALVLDKVTTPAPVISPSV